MALLRERELPLQTIICSLVLKNRYYARCSSYYTRQGKVSSNPFKVLVAVTRQAIALLQRVTLHRQCETESSQQ